MKLRRLIPILDDASPPGEPAAEQVTDAGTAEQVATAQASEVIVDALSQAARDALPASDFAVPGKRQLPMHDKKHAKLAWSMVATTKDLSAQETRTAYKRILARLKKFGIDTTNFKKKTVTDAAEPTVQASWPEELSLDDFRACLRAELNEQYPRYYLSDVYPGLSMISAWKSSFWNPDKEEYVYDNRCYTFTYTISDTDDGDGDIDLVNIVFSEPKVSIMTPKVIEDQVETVAPANVMILSDATERASGKLRIRLPGPRANVVNKNKRLYPLSILRDAIQRAQPMIKAGKMVSYCPHPKLVTMQDGTQRLEPQLENRVAIINAWVLDEQSGISYIDRTIIDGTQKSAALRGSIEAGAAVATSLRASAHCRQTHYRGEMINIADHLELGGDDFVENPALESTFTQAQVLTDAIVSVLLDTAEPISESQLQPQPAASAAAAATATPTRSDPPPASAATVQDARTDISPRDTAEPALAQATTTIAEADMKFRRNASGELVLDNEAGTLDGQGNPIADSNAPPASTTGAQAADPPGTGSTSQPPAVVAGAAAGASAPVVMDAENQEHWNQFVAERKATAQKTSLRSFLDSVSTGEETALPAVPTTKVKYDLSRFSEKERKLIVDSTIAHANLENVEDVLKSSIAMVDGMKADQRLSGMGYNSGAGGGIGETAGARVTVDAEDNQLVDHVNKLCQAMDDYGMQVSGDYRVRPELRKANEPFVTKLLDSLKAMPRNPNGINASTFLDADTTTAQLLNQATVTPVTAALIRQIFWQLSMLPYIGGIGPEGFNAGPGSDAGIGLNLRLAVWTRPDGRVDLRSIEGGAIDSITPVLRWLNFMAEWRKLAFTLTPEAETELIRGPARYNALAENMFMISQVFAENIDLELGHEMYNSSDEFNAVGISAESHVSGDLITDGPTLATMGYGANVTVAIKTSSTFTMNNVAYQSPVVPERLTKVIQEDGTVQDSLNTLINPIIAKIGSSTALVRGELDRGGNIVSRKGVPSAVYAVDYENGVFVFAAGASVDSTHIPALTYSKVTNFDAFDLGQSALADDVAIFYDSLLAKLDDVAADMGSSPRYKPPTFALFTLKNAVFASRARQAAQLFQPAGTDVRVTPATPNSFGDRSGLDFSKVNTPFRFGNTRILLGTLRATKYGIQAPWKVQGPIEKMIIVAGNDYPQPTGAHFWYGQQNGVICTPVCYDIVNSSVRQLNHPYRTIKLVGTGRL